MAVDASPEDSCALSVLLPERAGRRPPRSRSLSPEVGAGWHLTGPHTIPFFGRTPNPPPVGGTPHLRPVDRPSIGGTP